MHTSDYIRWFKDIKKEGINLAGGKGVNLAEMANNNFPVPKGFVITSEAYFDFIKENSLSSKIKHLTNLIDFNSHKSLANTSNAIKKEIIKGNLSQTLIKKILSAYNYLGHSITDALVAVRSSSNFEDLKDASFAGQQESFLNIKGDAILIHKIKEVWASLFNERAIFYRHENRLDHFRIGIAVVVQKMVNSDMSGIVFTLDPVSNDKTKIIIEAIYGLGELIAKGEVTPDHYKVSKSDMSVFYKDIAEQKIMLKKEKNVNKKTTVPNNKMSKQKITDEEIKKIATLAADVEKHYSYPQDIEWAIEKNKLFLLQTRPVTFIKSQKPIRSQITSNHSQILQGDPASPGIGIGTTNLIKSAKEIGKVNKGDVLVALSTNPDFVPAMKKAAAIVAEKGGRTSHAAIVSRELGIPAVVGAKNATKILKNKIVITVNGSTGNIYKGINNKHSKTIGKETASKPIATATKLYVNLSDPTLAEITALLNADGVGLLRSEFIMAQIGTHPKKMIRTGKSNAFIEMLSDGLEKFCKSFGERIVVYRTSDFKTNEYKNLIGGRQFEPTEPNPMLGFRGAFRYISDPEVFNLELQAIKRVRNLRGCKNLSIMIPFVRTVKELIKVKKLISNAGLYRSESFKIWMMVEVPSNVILLEKFINTGLDGVSIGSNDLTQLILGLDRDNSEVSCEFDEQNDAVLWAIEKVIKTCSNYKITSSICGQAPSMYPTLLEKLVKWGITSVSVSPDAVGSTKKLIAEYEKKVIWQK